MLCRCDYAERGFYHQILSEYYGGKISVSIEGIELENFIALPQTAINSSTKPCPCHEVFNPFLLDDSKKYATTNTAHRKRLIELSKEQKLLTSILSTIW